MSLHFVISWKTFKLFLVFCNTALRQQQKIINENRNDILKCKYSLAVVLDCKLLIFFYWILGNDGKHISNFDLGI